MYLCNGFASSPEDGMFGQLSIQEVQWIIESGVPTMEECTGAESEAAT
jgi:hypothetical protein